MRGAAIGPIVIAAGGTAGHLFPAQALAAELIRRGRWVVLMTDARTADRAADFPAQDRIVIRGAGIAGRGAAAVAGGVSIAAGVLQARAVLARLGPASIVGFGGYPSVAPVLGARLLRRRVPVVLHEQNAVLGRANRALARFADVIALSHAATLRIPPGVRTTVTGNPVREAIAKLSGAVYSVATPPRILVLGGSLGARVFSDVVPEAIAGLAMPVRVTQQCRAEDLGRVRAAYAATGVTAELATFFDDVPARLDAATLVIARAGASTVAELAVSGRPSVLVPLPGAIDDHQTANARALASNGAAWLIPQQGFSADTLARRLDDLLSQPAMLDHAAAQAASLGHPDAAARLADLVETRLRTRVPA